ncbi:MAG: tRNA-uridine aminocarboxypropyltransferase [Bdellovibrionota bacterium]
MFPVIENECEPTEPLRCFTCLSPKAWCYCHHIDSFDPNMVFVVLQHPLERRRRIATGRMTYLSLENANIFHGVEFDSNHEIQKWIDHDDYACFLLYPGAHSTNLSLLSEEQRKETFQTSQQKIVIFLIDGTWATSKKTLRLSPNLAKIPRITFDPPHPSRFLIRTQPKSNFYSTIEAAHQCIELLGPSQHVNVSSGVHHKMLQPFHYMIQQHRNFLANREKRGLGRTPRKLKRMR